MHPGNEQDPQMNPEPAPDHELAAALRRLRPPLPRAGFAAEALAGARRAHRPARWRAAMAPVCAATLAALAVSYWPAVDTPPPLAQVERSAAAVVLEMGEIQVVRLRVQANRDVEGARFKVRLPAQVEFADSPDLREIEWEGALRAGANVLSLPLLGLRETRGALLARVSAENQVRNLTVHLQVSASGAAL